MMEHLNVVLLHDWLTGFRGGERILEAFCEMFPRASIYTLIHKKGSVPISFEKHPIRTSFLNSIPGIHRHYRKFLPLFPLAIESMCLQEDNVDLIISSSHCVIKGLRKKGEAKHISYIHSPMRYIYDQFDVYFGPGSPPVQRLAIGLFRDYLQTWDRISNDNVDCMLANSHFVKERIRQFYEREAEVVHPFVELADFAEVQKGPVNKEDYYLMVTAFAPNKRVDLAIEAFKRLNYPLKIVGSGQMEKDLKRMAGKKVEFLGNLERSDIVHYLSKAKALIFPGVEDFGIVPLESLAAGTPVIAFKKGGVLETLHEGVGVFFESANCDSLIEAVRAFEGKSFERNVLFAQADKFSREKFQEKMWKIIRRTMEG